MMHDGKHVATMPTADERKVSASLAPLNEGVRRGIEDARDTAARTVEYLDSQIAKTERERDRLTEHIAEMREERARNAATLTEAEAMLNGR
jgi:hypothetical protein